MQRPPVFGRRASVFRAPASGSSVARGSVAPSVPSGSITLLDADDVNNASNVGLPNEGVLNQWNLAGSATAGAVFVQVLGRPVFKADRIGTHDAVLFDGVADFFSMHASSLSVYNFIPNTGVFDVVILLRRDINRAVGVFGSTVTNTQRGFFVGLSVTGQVILELRNGTSAFAALTTTATVPLLRFSYVRLRGDGTNIFVSINNGAEQSSPIGTLSTGNASSLCFLGARPGGGTGNFFSGAMLYLGVWDRGLTAAEWAGLRATFASRYGTPSTQTGIVCLGDSITAGTSVDFPWPMKVGFISATEPIIANQGLPGDTAAQGRTRWTNQIRGAGYTRLVHALGINTIRTGVVGSATTAMTSISATLDEARADGLNPIVVNVTPGNGFAGWNAQASVELDALNASLASYASTHSLTLVDAYAMLKDGTDPYALAAANDSGDHLHPSQAGANLIAAAVKTALGL